MARPSSSSPRQRAGAPPGGPPAAAGRRSTLVAILTGGWTVAFAGLAGAFLSSPLGARRREGEVAIGPVTAFGSEFTPVRVRVPVDDGWYEHADQRTVFVRVEASGAPVVFSATCSHLGCTVTWHAEQALFRCPCHGGRFGPDGRVLGGPPPAPLAVLDATSRDGTIYARFP